MAVIAYSGTPMRRPAKSSGFSIPAFLLMKTHECRKNLEGKTGMALNGGLGRERKMR